MIQFYRLKILFQKTEQDLQGPGLDTLMIMDQGVEQLQKKLLKHG